MSESQYFTRQERIERKDALRKHREELRNAVRFCMTEIGISPHTIENSAKEMALDASTKVIKRLTTEGTMEALMRKVIREEIDKTLRAGRGESFQSILNEMVRLEAQKYAKEFVEQNVQVRLIGGDF